MHGEKEIKTALKEKESEMTFDPDKIPSYFLRGPAQYRHYLEAEDVLQQEEEVRRTRRRSLSASPPIYWRSSIVVSWQRRKKAARAFEEGEDLLTASKASVLGKSGNVILTSFAAKCKLDFAKMRLSVMSDDDISPSQIPAGLVPKIRPRSVRMRAGFSAVCVCVHVYCRT